MISMRTVQGQQRCQTPSFLYPLNALIASQRKRMHALGVRFRWNKLCTFNGDTDNNPIKKDKIQALRNTYPGKQIRDTPPQILVLQP